MKKRLLSFSLCVCMLFTMLPMGTLVMADEGSGHSHPVCGASHSDIYGHTGECEALVWQPWDGSDMDPDTEGVQLKAGNWYLEDDLVYPYVIYIVGDVNFCFNGHYIISTGTSTIFRSDDGYTLSVCDCSDVERKFTVGDDGVWVLDDESGTKTLVGGGLTGVDTEWGTTVFMNKGTFKMYGGNVVGNQARGSHSDGAIINADSIAYVYIYGGNICGNKAYNIQRNRFYTGHIYGGKIFDNRVEGAAVVGIYDIQIAGNIEIYNNISYKDGKTKDLSASTYVTIADDLSVTNPIYVCGEFYIKCGNSLDISEYFDIFEIEKDNVCKVISNDNKRISFEYYDITDNPSESNNYTAGVNYETNANYKWYKTDCSYLTPDMGKISQDVAYDEATGLWSYIGSESQPSGYTVIEDVYLNKGDGIIVISPSGAGNFSVKLEEATGYYRTISSGSVLEISNSGIYKIGLTSAYDKPDFKAFVLRNKELVEEQTGKTFNTQGMKSGYYVPEVVWDKGTPDDTTDDYTATGEYFTYYTDELSGGLTVSGKAVVGKTLKAKYNGIEDFTYQWYRDDVAIDGATTRLYTVTEDDLDAVLKVVVSGSGDYTGAVSAETAAVLAVDPNPDEPDYPDEIKPDGCFAVKSTDVNELEEVFGDFAEITDDGDKIKIKLTKDMWGYITFQDGEGDFILDLNGKTITPDFYKYGIYVSGNFDGTVTITGSGKVCRGTSYAVNTYSGSAYFAVEEGKDYFTAVYEDGNNVFDSKNTETKSKSHVSNTFTIEQKMFTDYTVKFNRNGGSGSMANQVINVGEDTALSANTFTNDDKVFVGWATSADGGVVYADKEVVTDITTKGQEITLYAVWQDVGAQTYTVTFDANGGTVTPAASTTDTSGKLASLPTPTKSGSYRFNGWFTAASGGTEITTDTVFIEDSTIYAQWTYTGSSGGGSRYYNVTFNTNGGSKITSQRLRRNAVATEPEEPTKDGFEFEGWYTDKEFKNAYDFATKVTKSITLYAKWVEAKPVHICSSDKFSDLDKTKWYHEDIDYVIENNIMLGTSDTVFAPEENLTRGMLVTILYRSEGEPATNRSIPFADVDMGAYYANAVTWAQQNGIVKGISETEYAPDMNVTREQLATIMLRYAQFKGMDAVTTEENLGFNDASDISVWAVAAMNWGVGRDYIFARTEGAIAPKVAATRAEIAAFIHRYIVSNEK